MSGGVPANTTTTTTVNQSPWQNPTYQALMLGTKDNPGPITNILRSNAGYMNAYNNLLAQGITPMDVVRSNQYNPTAGGAGTSFQAAAPAQAAAEGGIMNARGYAPGGAPKPKPVTPQVPRNATAEQRADAINAAMQQGYKPKGNEVAFLNHYADSAGVANANVGAVIDPKTGVAKPRGRNPNESTADYNKYLSSYQQAGGSIPKNVAKQYNVPAPQTQGAANTANAQQRILEQSMGQTAFTRVNDKGQLESTNPLFNQAVNRVLDAQQLPSQFGQATDMFGQAASGLAGKADYSPQQVSAQQVDAANISRGSIRDAEAQRADVASMQGGPNVNAINTQAASMAGPASWNAPGTVQQYMDPYIQSVVDQSKFEANRQAAQQRNQMRSRAAGSKAFGGSRAALEEAEADRNLGYTLEDIQNKGLSQAYQQGLQQFNTAQGQGLQAGQANLTAAMQANLANQQAGMTAQQLNQLYGQGGFQANAANMAAQNTANNNYVQQQLAAQFQNQGMDFNTAQQNASMLMQSRLANQNAALQAGMANQNAGLQANAQGIQAYGAMGNMAQGLGNLGVSQAQTNLANIGALGQAASAWQNLGQQYLNTQQGNALNAINFPSSLYSGALNAINAQPSMGGTTTATGTSSPASWMGRAEGGEVEAHKEWDKAKGGKTAKTGIASRGWN